MPRPDRDPHRERTRSLRRPKWFGRFFSGFAKAGIEACGKPRAMPQAGLSYIHMFAVCSAKEANHGA